MIRVSFFASSFPHIRKALPPRNRRNSPPGGEISTGVEYPDEFLPLKASKDEDLFLLHDFTPLSSPRIRASESAPVTGQRFIVGPAQFRPARNADLQLLTAKFETVVAR